MILRSCEMSMCMIVVFMMWIPFIYMWSRIILNLFATLVLCICLIFLVQKVDNTDLTASGSFKVNGRAGFLLFLPCISVLLLQLSLIYKT